MTTLLIRADADAQMGTGHLMRCLALAQAVRAEKGRAVFLSRCESESLRQRVEAAGIPFHPLGERHPHPADLSTTLALLREMQAAWLMLDGYHFDATYQRAVRGAGHRLLVIDDIAHLPKYHADLLLNQNIHAAQLGYACGPDTRLLLGPRYALLRPEYLRWGGWHREIPDLARKVLVTMGGGDPDNVTLRIIRVLSQVRGIGLEVKVVVGPASPHLDELRRAADGNEMPLHLLTNVTDMSALMAWADIGLAAGGSTCWELAFMGLPSVVMVLAENQDGIAAALDSAGIAMNVGWYDRVSEARLTEVLIELLMSPERRHRMSRSGQQLIDGGGAGRVIEALRAGLTAASG